MRGAIRVVLIACLGLLLAAGVRAQDETPGAGNVAGCLVEPRTDAEMEAIRSTPGAGDAVEQETGQAVTPIDEDTRAAIEHVILMADACAKDGDFARLAALYSPWAIQNGVLDGETVPIVAGTPEGVPGAEQPDPGKAGPAVVRAGWWVDGNHVVVEVERGNSVRQVRVVTIDGAWLIDSVEVVTEELVEDGAGGAGTPDLGVVLPVEVIQAIADLLVAESEGEASTAAITILSAEAVDWTDTFLGCPVEGAFAAQVITPGYLVRVEYEGEEFEVHTDLTGHAVAC